MSKTSVLMDLSRVVDFLLQSFDIVISTGRDDFQAPYMGDQKPEVSNSFQTISSPQPSSQPVFVQATILSFEDGCNHLYTASPSP